MRIEDGDGKLLELDSMMMNNNNEYGAGPALCLLIFDLSTIVESILHAYSISLGVLGMSSEASTHFGSFSLPVLDCSFPGRSLHLSYIVRDSAVRIGAKAESRDSRDETHDIPTY